MNGPGFWSFSGANTYAGQTLINGGVLVVLDATSLGVADNTLANGTIINGGTLSLGGNLAINEYFRMFPSANPAIVGGGIHDLQGTLELVSGQVEVYSDIGPIRLLGKITGNGGLTTRGGSPGLFEISNPANDFQGPIVVNSADVILTADHVLPPRDVTMASFSTIELHGTTQTIASLSGSVSNPRVKLGTGGTLNVLGPATTVFDGPIQDSGTVALQGGDLTLRDASTFTGSFTNSSATLRVVGPFAIMPAPYTQSSGTLAVSDSGSVGPVTINGGTFVPGAVGQAFAKTGNLALGGGTAYSELINGPAAVSSFAFTRVTGSVSLGGSALHLTGSGAGIASGTQFVIIDNDGSDPVAGTFNGLPEGAVIPLGPGNVYYRISYMGGTGNDVVLTALTATNVPALSPLALLVLGAMLAATAVIALRR
jgi:autotransporter-associated beta strand protein